MARLSRQGYLLGLIVAVIGTRGFPDVQGGVEKHCESIYPKFAGQENSDVLLRVYRRKPYLTEVSLSTDYNHITFVDLPSTRYKGFEAAFHTLLCVLHCITHRTDIVHVHNIGPGMFAPLLRLFGRKVVLTYHSPNYEHKKWGLLARLVLKWSETLAMRFSHKIIFVNKFQREKFGDAVKAKSVYIPNGIPATTRSADTSFLQRHGIVPGKYLLSVGRLTEEKGFEYLVATVNKMPQVQQLVIAGASDNNKCYFEKLKKLDRAKKVIFTGFTTGENLRQLYSHARLYVLSSVNEGFPLVLLEAMSYGLPLAVSDIPATRLVDIPATSYFEVANEESMQRCLERQFNQPEGEVLHYNLTPFDWNAIAQQTFSVLKSVK